MTNRINQASRISPAGQRISNSAPFAEIRLTQKDVQDPASLHRILTKMWDAHREVSRAQRGASRLRGTTFEGLAFSNGVAFSLQHGFGVKVRYAVVGWQGANSLGYPPWTVNDGTTLTITPNATGTADLEVWSV